APRGMPQAPRMLDRRYRVRTTPASLYSSTRTTDSPGSEPALSPADSPLPDAPLPHHSNAPGARPPASRHQAEPGRPTPDAPASTPAPRPHTPPALASPA